MSRTWSHQVRVVRHDRSRVTLYCEQSGGVLRTVAGDCDTAPGQKVAIRRGTKWEPALSWAAGVEVIRRREPEVPDPTRLIVYAQVGARVFPALLTVTADDADARPVTWTELRDHGVTCPAGDMPYRRMASLTPEERAAYHEAKAKDRELLRKAERGEDGCFLITREAFYKTVTFAP